MQRQTVTTPPASPRLRRTSRPSLDLTPSLSCKEREQTQRKGNGGIIPPLFKGRLGGVTIFILALYCFTALLVPAPASAAEGVVINEVQITGGAGMSSHDFIELYNPNSESFNLKGHRLVKRTANGTSDTSIKSWRSDAVIPANGFYLWASSGDDTFALANSADTTTSQTIAANNGIALRAGDEDTGTIIDSVAWGSAANAFITGVVFPENPGGGQSIGRTGGADTHNNAVDFTLQAPTPGAANGGAVADEADAANGDEDLTPDPLLQGEGDDDVGGGDDENSSTTSTGSSVQAEPPKKKPWLRFTEVFPNPRGSDMAEFIELRNDGDVVALLGGWRITTRHNQSYTFEQGFLYPGRYLVIHRRDTNLIIQNDGETLSLIDPVSGKATDTLELKSAPEGETRMLRADGNWRWTIQPTPGAANEYREEPRAPKIVMDAPDKGTTAQILSFDASDSYDQYGQPLTHSWNFGDGTAPTVAAYAYHQYFSPGSYTVTLTVTNTKGLASEKTTTVTITGEDLLAPASGSLSSQERVRVRSSEDSSVRTQTSPPTLSYKERENYDAATKTTTLPPPPTPPQAGGETMHAQTFSPATTWMHGTVTVPPGIIAATFVYIYCTNPCAGQGIKLRMARAEWPDMKRGDEVQVTGRWSDAGGEQSFLTNAAQVTVIPARKRFPIPEPAIPELTDSDLHTYLALTGEITEKHGANIFLDDGRQEIEVEMKNTDHRSALYEGDRATVMGVLAKTDDGYRLRASDPPLILTAHAAAPTTTEIRRERDPVAERNRMLLFAFIFLAAIAVYPAYQWCQKKNTAP